MSVLCCIGKLESTVECDVRSKEAIKVADLIQSDLSLLSLRIESFEKNDDDYICYPHYEKYIKQYEYFFKRCCDPFSKHRKVGKISLVTLNLDTCLKYKILSNGIKIVPGKQVCLNCLKQINFDISLLEQCYDPFKRHRQPVKENLRVLNEKICQDYSRKLSYNLPVNRNICNTCYQKIECNLAEVDKDEPNSQNSAKSIQSTSKEWLTETPSGSSPSTLGYQDSDFCTNSQQRRQLDTMFESLGLPPLVRDRENEEIFKNKVTEQLQKVMEVFSSEIERTFSVQISSVDIVQARSNASSLASIIENIKIKYTNETEINKKISSLTLLPENWSYKETTQLFECSAYMWSTARRIRDDMGILGVRKRKEYNFISPLMKQSIIDFYYENSRMCSGMKESIKVKVPGEKSISLQKRLLLHNLKDLYEEWKEHSNFDSYPSFSTFAALRPVECVLAGSPGTHTVCVCPIHQNFKLELNSVQCQLKAKELIEKTVCSIDNKNCMFRQCEKCSTNIKKAEYRQMLVDNSKITDGIITYKNWVTVTDKNPDGVSNRTVLETFEECYDSFMNELSKDLWDLALHHFVSENQKNYLSDCKKELKHDTCLLMMDFAEKYAFIAQESSQGFYFNNTTAVVHPIVMYYKDREDDTIKVQSFCIISNAKKQTASTVNIFQEKVLNYIKEKWTFIANIIYFSDGCPTQYKNKNHLRNICHHKTDFGLDVTSYNFFSTSHGKNACDGIGAVAKRAARRASLQNIYEGHILNPKQMYDYLNENIDKIRFFYVDEKEVNARERKLKTRYESTKTIPDTRKHHCFIPVNQSTMEIKIYSVDDDSKVLDMLK